MKIVNQMTSEASSSCNNTVLVFLMGQKLTAFHESVYEGNGERNEGRGRQKRREERETHTERFRIYNQF
jgi:hypothetical protein